MSNSQIAEARGTTVRAVEGMISRIFQALDIDANGPGNARIAASKAYLSAVGAVATDQ
jgi:DNA-binding NarL/FixJ family response regulator